MNTLKHLDLFSGIGGFALAARWTENIDTVGFCEIEPYARKILKKNFPIVPVENDIKELRNNGQYGAVDIITGGFPCQPFSVAGRKKGTEDDRDLWPEMFRIIKEFEPSWVIGENVAHFLKMAFTRTKIDLESIGYRVQPLTIPACATGAPHRRDRLWILAYSDSLRQKSRLQAKYDTEKNEKGSADTVKRSSKTKAKRCNRWEPEPTVGRVAHGIPSRVDRLKGLGNAIVPQVAYEIFEAILTNYE